MRGRERRGGESQQQWNKQPEVVQEELVTGFAVENPPVEVVSTTFQVPRL